ncbi:MAG: cbb3-type cytochrome c oxidase subunit II [Opitutales bacterium]|nr:cbb3-type cytochrome c oxidase subunit II [Opitutales bacterium]MCH8540308.1 cbb3-type cytochrome c oxidase subunit II [Opitutales bacterium]
MKSLPLIFLGVFFTLAFSWTGIVLIPQQQFGSLERQEAEDGQMHPAPLSGLAKKGLQVYLDLGCVYCHSHQVRRPGFGGDSEWGWGDRQSVARDYINQPVMVLGTMRTGPDLKNVGDRIPDAGWHYTHLYDSRLMRPDSIMPPYRFLFEKRRITGEPHPRALSGLGDQAPPEGYEIVPTRRADALVAFLLSQRLNYDLEEAQRQF